MKENEPSLDSLFKDIIKRSVASVLKPHGFRKVALNFHRRLGDVVQVINIQRSHGSSFDEKLFYVNVGIAFDSICRLTDLPILEKPKESDCSSRGTRARLEHLLPRTPEVWRVREDIDLELVADRLQFGIERLIEELNQISDESSYRNHRWFDRFRPMRENAQIMYLLGDFEGALAEIKQLTKLFSGREGLKEGSWWIEELGLADLKG